MDYLTFPFNINTMCSTTGIDNIYSSANRPIASTKDWVTYPYPISYRHNSRGFGCKIHQRNSEY